MVRKIIILSPGMAAITIFTLAIMTSFLNGVIGYPSGEFLYQSFAKICHQIPTRSFWLFSQPLPICTRCLGGYLSVFIGACAFFAIRRKYPNIPLVNVYSIAITLFLIAILEAIIKPLDGNWWRFFSGGMGGFGAALAFSVIISFSPKWSKK